jgi:hypothetical protein
MTLPIGGNSLWDRSMLSNGEQSLERRTFSPGGALLIRLRVLHRRLWILNATFESFLARVEWASRRDDDGSDDTATADTLSGRTPPRERTSMTGLPARWRLARLRSRADRAEARAAVAIERAAATLALADAAVRDATEARARTDAARPGPSCVLDQPGESQPKGRRSHSTDDDTTRGKDER